MNQAQLDFIEQLGLSFERVGAAPMFGRIYGALLIAPETELCAEELAATLHASRGSISQATRGLISLGLIERTRKPGVRKDFFRVKPGAWMRATLNKQAEIETMRSIFQQGLEQMSDYPAAARAALEENIDFLNFWEESLTQFAEAWDQHKEKLRDQRDSNNQSHQDIR